MGRHFWRGGRNLETGTGRKVEDRIWSLLYDLENYLPSWTGVCVFMVV